MKITHAEIILTKIPTKRLHRMSFATTRHRECVYLKLYTDEGIVGLGAAPHMADSGAGETQGTVALQLRDRLLPAVLGKTRCKIRTAPG